MNIYFYVLTSHIHDKIFLNTLVIFFNIELIILLLILKETTKIDIIFKEVSLKMYIVPET